MSSLSHLRPKEFIDLRDKVVDEMLRPWQETKTNPELAIQAERLMDLQMILLPKAGISLVGEFSQEEFRAFRQRLAEMAVTPVDPQGTRVYFEDPELEDLLRMEKLLWSGMVDLHALEAALGGTAHE